MSEFSPPTSQRCSLISMNIFPFCPCERQLHDTALGHQETSLMTSDRPTEQSGRHFISPLGFSFSSVELGIRNGGKLQTSPGYQYSHSNPELDMESRSWSAGESSREQQLEVMLHNLSSFPKSHGCDETSRTIENSEKTVKRRTQVQQMNSPEMPGDVVFQV